MVGILLSKLINFVNDYGDTVTIALALATLAYDIRINQYGRWITIADMEMRASEILENGDDPEDKERATNLKDQALVKARSWVDGKQERCSYIMLIASLVVLGISYFAITFLKDLPTEAAGVAAIFFFGSAVAFISLLINSIRLTHSYYGPVLNHAKPTENQREGVIKSFFGSLLAGLLGHDALNQSVCEPEGNAEQKNAEEIADKPSDPADEQV